jgi:hypothetical protein
VDIIAIGSDVKKSRLQVLRVTLVSSYSIVFEGWKPDFNVCA